MHRSLPLLLLIASFAAAPAPAATPIPGAPAVDARAYILVDYRTGKTLAAQEADARMEPASLTKLMTAYIVFDQLASGKLKLDEPVLVSEHAWRSEGSRTFIELGKPVSVELLILGMIVQSGNDATIALAERVAGTEETFVQLMNTYAKRLGMAGTHFDNSSGLPSPNHYTTARDMSLLAIAMIRDFPQYYKYYSVREFEHNGIKQQNRNGLLEQRSDRRRIEDRPHRFGRLLPGDLGAARRHAAGFGGARIDQHEGPRERERRAAGLRLHVLRHQVGGQGRRRARLGAGVEGGRIAGRRRRQGRCLRHRAARRGEPTSRPRSTCSRV